MYVRQMGGLKSSRVEGTPSMSESRCCSLTQVGPSAWDRELWVGNDESAAHSYVRKSRECVQAPVDKCSRTSAIKM